MLIMSERVKAIRITNPDTIQIVAEVVEDVNAKTFTSIAERMIHERAAQMRAEREARKREQPATREPAVA